MSAEAAPSFAALLRRYRQERGLTQERLAELAEVGVRTLSDLESGVTRQPQRETAQRLVGALHLAAAEQARLLAAVRATPRRRPEAGGQPDPAAGGRRCRER